MTTYDEWRLQGPEECAEIGTKHGDTCGRYHEPDQDAQRGYKPKPCTGMMEEIDGMVICDICCEIADAMMTRRK